MAQLADYSFLLAAVYVDRLVSEGPRQISHDWASDRYLPWRVRMNCFCHHCESSGCNSNRLRTCWQGAVGWVARLFFVHTKVSARRRTELTDYGRQLLYNIERSLKESRAGVAPTVPVHAFDVLRMYVAKGDDEIAVR